MKTIILFLSVFFGVQTVQGQEFWNRFMHDQEYWNEISAGHWSITIQKNPIHQTQETKIFSKSQPICEVRRIDQEPDIPFLKCPEVPLEDTSVKKLINYTNLIVDYFNRDQLEELNKTLAENWEREKGRLKYRYVKYEPVSCIFYGNENETGKRLPTFLVVASGLKSVGPPVESLPETEESGIGDRIRFVSILFVVIAGGKIQSAGGYHPLINEEYCSTLCCLKTTESDFPGHYYTFSYKDWPEKGHEKSTPFFRWNVNGKIIGQGLKNFMFEDFDILTFLSGSPSLRGL